MYLHIYNVLLWEYKRTLVASSSTIVQPPTQDLIYYSMYRGLVPVSPTTAPPASGLCHQSTVAHSRILSILLYLFIHTFNLYSIKPMNVHSLRYRRIVPVYKDYQVLCIHFTHPLQRFIPFHSPARSATRPRSAAV